MSRRSISLLVGCFALSLTSAAHAGGPTMILGAAEDIVRSPDLVQSKEKMSLLRLAGFTAVRVTSQWLPGEIAPPEDEVRILGNVDTAARLEGVRVVLSVYPPGSRSTPLTAEAQAQFVQYIAALVAAFPSFRDVVVGNEPNGNRFWMPQFGPTGADVAAPAYLSLLAQSYDAIKAVAPSVTVWGGALAPRGVDRPGTGKDTHSPVAFLRDLGAAYRASGRTVPIMDGLAFHPYADTSRQSPDVQHPKTTTIGLGDYDRLVATLGKAFDGTAQEGSTLPVLYDEFGVQTRPPTGKASAYTGTEPATTGPVDEATQGAYYSRAIQLAFCQPTVAGLMLFHSQDEPALPTWQSGVYYADGTLKSSFYAVRDALQRARGGSIAHCDGLALDVQPLGVHFPTTADIRHGRRVVHFRCSLDCAWQVTVLRLNGATVGSRRGFGRADDPLVASFRGLRAPAGGVRLRLTVTHPLNPGTPASRESGTLVLR